MRSTTLRAAALTALVTLAGCAGGLSGTPAPGTDGRTNANAGTVQFYVSDQPNAIDDFEHLNVTVSRIDLQRGGENGSRVEYEVANRTVDLTRLKGDNATLVGEFPAENGTYTKVSVHVEEVNATLENGERTRVKLPSEKLQITKPFTVEANQSVAFVFDIAVHEAGKSGKYILRPVIAQSGTDVPVDDVDDRGDEDGDREDREDREDADDLAASFVGDVAPGANATVEVTRNGTPVENATVVVNGDAVGTTGADGRITVPVPADAEELEVEVTAGGSEAELEMEFEGGDERDAEDDEAGDLTAEFVGEVEPGANATVEVTRNGTPVENATVVVNGETVGTTDASGRLAFDVPANATELTVEVTDGDDETEIEAEFREDG